jgi:hypothetical protein
MNTTQTEQEVLTDLDNQAAEVVDALREYIAQVVAKEAQIGRTRPHGREITFETNRKYHRVYAFDGGSRSVVVFVDRQTGDIWAPHGWKGPSKTYAGNVLALRAVKQRQS